MVGCGKTKKSEGVIMMDFIWFGLTIFIAIVIKKSMILGGNYMTEQNNIDGGTTSSRLTFSGGRAQTRVNTIVIHHTASNDVPINVHHRNHTRLGWGGVGYHYIIRANGAIEVGRPENLQGAHARGANTNSIGIAISGNLQNNALPDVQLNALVNLVLGIKQRHNITRVIRHSDVSATACPGKNFPWQLFLSRIA